jgi:hypothetical protein
MSRRPEAVSSRNPSSFEFSLRPRVSAKSPSRHRPSLLSFLTTTTRWSRASKPRVCSRPCRPLRLRASPLTTRKTDPRACRPLPCAPRPTALHDGLADTTVERLVVAVFFPTAPAHALVVHQPLVLTSAGGLAALFLRASGRVVARTAGVRHPSAAPPLPLPLAHCRALPSLSLHNSRTRDIREAQTAHAWSLTRHPLSGRSRQCMTWYGCCAGGADEGLQALAYASTVPLSCHIMCSGDQITVASIVIDKLEHVTNACPCVLFSLLRSRAS